MLGCPREIAFTIECSVRTAWEAIYRLLDRGPAPPPVYQGQYDPRALIRRAEGVCQWVTPSIVRPSHQSVLRIRPRVGAGSRGDRCLGLGSCFRAACNGPTRCFEVSGIDPSEQDDLYSRLLEAVDAADRTNVAEAFSEFRTRPGQFELKRSSLVRNPITSGSCSSEKRLLEKTAYRSGCTVLRSTARGGAGLRRRAPPR